MTYLIGVYVAVILTNVASWFIAQYLYKHALRKKNNYFVWSISVSLKIATVLSVIASAIALSSIHTSHSFGALAAILIAPAIPPLVIGFSTVIICAGIIYWGYRKPDYFPNKGVDSIPQTKALITSGSILLVTLLFVLYSVLPMIHTLPYTSLSGGSPLRGQNYKLIALKGHKSYEDDYKKMFTEIITVDLSEMSTYSAQFRLKLDWRGRAQLDVEHPPDPFIGRVVKSYYLPFEKSRYKMVDKKPVRIE